MGGGGGAAQFVRGNYKSFKGINVTVLKRMQRFIMEGEEAERAKQVKLCVETIHPLGG